MSTQPERQKKEKAQEVKNRSGKEWMRFARNMAIALVIVLAFATVPFAASAYVASLVEDVKESSDNFRFEIAKYLLQLSIVVIVGGFVGFLYREVGKWQQRTETRSEIRADYLNRLGDAYRKVKASRRSLQAGGLTTEPEHKSKKGLSEKLTEAQVHLYFEEMKRIDEAQLAFEALKIEARSLPPFIPLDGVAPLLGTMEDYLRAILREYETKALLFESQAVVFGDLERLNEFTGDPHGSFTFSKAVKSKKNYRFISHFANPYDDVIEEISRSLD